MPEDPTPDESSESRTQMVNPGRYITRRELQELNANPTPEARAALNRLAASRKAAESAITPSDDVPDEEPRTQITDPGADLTRAEVDQANRTGNRGRAAGIAAERRWGGGRKA